MLVTTFVLSLLQQKPVIMMKTIQFTITDYTLYGDRPLLEKAISVGEDIRDILDSPGTSPFFDTHKKLMSLMIHFHLIMTESKKRFPEAMERIENQVSFEALMNQFNIKLNEQDSTDQEEI